MATGFTAEAPPNHPFDNAYGVMKRMQGEIDELRQALRAEQDQRAQENGLLQRQVSDLKTEMRDFRDNHSVDYERMRSALTAETALRGKALQKVSEEIALAVRRAAEVENMRDQFARQFGALAAECKMEKRDRLKGQQELDERLLIEVDTRTELCTDLANELRRLEETFRCDICEDREQLSKLAENVQLAGDLLSTVQQHKEDSELHLTSNSALSTAFGCSPSPDMGTGAGPASPASAGAGPAPPGASSIGQDGCPSPDAVPF